MAAGEGAGVTLPALGVDGAAEHDRRVAGHVVDLGRRPRLRVAAGVAHGRSDALGDLRRRRMLARVDHEHGALDTVTSDHRGALRAERRLRGLQHLRGELDEAGGVAHSLSYHDTTLTCVSFMTLMSGAS